MEKIKANYSQSEGRAVGGKLALGDESLVFEPRKLDELTGGENIEITYDDIREVGKKGRFEEGLKDSLYGGGMRKRLSIETTGGEEFWFVVSNLDDVIESVQNRVEEGREPSQVARGSGEEAGVEEWNPRFPILSVFAALLIARSAFFSLANANPADGAILLILAILIVPRVRRYVGDVIESAIGLNIRTRVFQIIAGLVYSVLIAASGLLLIGEAVNDPTMSAGTGALSIPIFFVMAVVIVYLVRLIG
jgi:hypothetical protein